MLPESQFPATGAIMQTDKVLLRAHSTELDDSTATENKNLSQKLEVKFTQNYSPLIQSFTDMAVKQESQEDDEHGYYSNKFSPPMEMESIQSISDCSPSHTEREMNQSHQEHESVETSSMKNGSKSLPNRGRRKSRWKLKFHHQALPPEYLDHYEAAVAQETSLNSPLAQGSSESLIATKFPTTSGVPLNLTPAVPKADVQTWLQRLALMQSEFYSYPLQTYQPAAGNLDQASYSRQSVITSTQSPKSVVIDNSEPIKHYQKKYLQERRQQQQGLQQNSQRNNTQTTSNPRPPMKYSDLPYMGEITLDNSKPRRGRKPKKADICHLIYKNYGTILPGTPGLEYNLKSPVTREKTDNNDSSQVPISFQRTDIQNRISSLLEKRLTQEKKAFELTVDSTKEQEEPLNLCIRDLNLLKIRLNDRYNNIFEFKSYNSKNFESSDGEVIDKSQNFCGTEQPVGLEIESMSNSESRVNDDKKKELNLGNHSVNIDNIGYTNHNNKDNNNNKDIDDDDEGDDYKSDNISQQYNLSGDNENKIKGRNNDFLNNNDPELKKKSHLLCWEKNSEESVKPSGLQSQLIYYKKKSSTLDVDLTNETQRIASKSIYSLFEGPRNPSSLKAGSLEKSTEVVETGSGSGLRSKRNTTTQGGQQQGAKRKRSAIFIPPMPTENNSNPATEVSICKFKFTGGAKPSLQEKKSLSVDSGGNFRYYSGTGDKSMRGYEFFPRESLQQPANHAGASSAAGAFMNAAAERLPQGQGVYPNELRMHEEIRRRRKTRKSVQREKLEQTFKEKGFLIQTQQLESAEGATYCKFRQLRKFTRYLFRSWKDYLPGNVHELATDPQLVPPEPSPEHDLDSLPISPSSSNNLDLQPNFLEPHSSRSLTLN